MRRLKQFVIVIAALAATGYLLMNSRVEAKVFGGPPLGFTGAPGEGTCVGCHYTFGDPNPPNTGGSVVIAGLPTNYAPGQSYTVTVTVAHPTARRWGFEITAITAAGTSTGAGTLALIDSVRTIKRDSEASGFPRTYISHYAVENRPESEDGTYPGKTGSNTWSFTWTAPMASAGDITFYAVGNAANNQVSPEDDYIYTKSFTARAPNSAPVLSSLPDRTLAPGDRIRFTVSATDAEGQALTYNASALANAGFDPATRRFTFAPSAEQTGEQQVTFTVSDGSLEASQTIRLKVAAEGSALLAALDKAGSDYLDHTPVSGLDLTAVGEFGSGAKILFNGLELTSQTSLTSPTGAPGMTAQIPASELADAGAYVVRVRLGDGTLTNARTLALASSINAQPASTVDAASYRPSLAAGQIAALFGGNLIVGSESGTPETTPLPKSLRGTSVYVNGVAAGLFFVSPGQINYQIPYGTAAGAAQVVVYREDGIASQGTIEVTPAAPAIFTLNSSGQGQAAALNLDFSPNGDPTLGAQFKRVRKNDFIILYATGTGTGLIDSATGQAFTPVDGSAVPAGKLITTSALPTVTIGGRPATVTFSGLSTGFVGLWQMNIQVPSDAPSGAAVALVLMYGDRPANPVTIAVE